MRTFNTLKAAVGLGALLGGLFATNAAQAGLPALSVSGNKIIQNGQPYVLGGIGLSGDAGIYPSPAPWTDSTDTNNTQNYTNALNFFKSAVDLVTNRSPLYGRNYGWGARMIRFGLTPDWFDPNRNGTSFNDAPFQAYVDKVVAPLCAYCQQKGVYIILDTGYVTDSTTWLLQHNWPQYNQDPSKGVIYKIWDYIANSYFDNHSNHTALRDSNVLYEIYNECVNVEGYNDAGSEAAWQDQSGRLQLVVDRLRNVLHVSNICLIGTPNFDSQPQWILKDQMTGSNLAYVEHIYPGGNYPSSMSVSTAYNNIDSSGYYGQTGASKLGDVAAKVPLVVTEFNWFQNGNGTGPYQGTTSVFGKALRQWINDKAAGYSAWTYGEMLSNRFNLSTGNGLDSNAENFGQSAYEMLWVTFFYSGGQVPYQFNSTGVYRLTPMVNSNACLDVAGAGTASPTAVQEYTYHNQPNQKWYFQNLNNGRYRLTPSFNSGGALDVMNSYTANNTDVREYAWNTSTAQQWWVTSLGDGSYRLTPGSYSDGALDVYGFATIDGSRIDEYSWNGSSAQRWYISQQ